MTAAILTGGLAIVAGAGTSDSASRWRSMADPEAGAHGPERSDA